MDEYPRQISNLSSNILLGCYLWRELQVKITTSVTGSKVKLSLPFAILNPVIQLLLLIWVIPATFLGTDTQKILWVEVNRFLWWSHWIEYPYQHYFGMGCVIVVVNLTNQKMLIWKIIFGEHWEYLSDLKSFQELDRNEFMELPVDPFTLTNVRPFWPETVHFRLDRFSLKIHWTPLG